MGPAHYRSSQHAGHAAGEGSQQGPHWAWHRAWHPRDSRYSRSLSIQKQKKEKKKTIAVTKKSPASLWSQTLHFVHDTLSLCVSMAPCVAAGSSGSKAEIKPIIRRPNTWLGRHEKRAVKRGGSYSLVSVPVLSRRLLRRSHKSVPRFEAIAQH